VKVTHQALVDSQSYWDVNNVFYVSEQRRGPNLASFV
jgi:hypothetical protein